MSGCAALTNPVANGIPVRLLPDDLLAESASELEDIPLTLLRRKPDESYRLATGDVLGVYIEGVLGETDELPPVNFPDVANVEPSIGFPIPVRENGTVPLPLVEPVDVDGLTIEEAEEAIIKAYTADKEIIKADEARILVTLIRPRRAIVLVVREDSPASQSGSNFNIFSRAAPLAPGRQQGTGIALELPATESDVLNVLARTGGLPGPSSAQEVVILRGFADSQGGGGFPTDSNGNYDLNLTDWCNTNQLDENGRPRKLKIPLRWDCDEPIPFGPDDILLETGDIVYVPAGEPRIYFTGGLLPSREVPMPLNSDLSVIEAILRVGGPLISGGFQSNTLSGGGITGAGIGNPSPSLLSVIRQTPDGGQAVIRVDLNRAARDRRENILIQPGDVLVLQETPQEAMSRYVSQVFNLNIFTSIFQSGSATVTGTGLLP